MERSLEEVPFCVLRHGTVAMEISEPLWEVWIPQMTPRPVRNEFETVEIPLLARQTVCLQIGDDRLALRPPELHILLIAL